MAMYNICMYLATASVNNRLWIQETREHELCYINHIILLVDKPNWQTEIIQVY